MHIHHDRVVTTENSSWRSGINTDKSTFVTPEGYAKVVFVTRFRDSEVQKASLCFLVCQASQICESYKKLTRNMSLETVPRSSDQYFGRSEPLDTESLLEYREKTHTKLASYSSLHLWSWAGQIVLFLISIFLASGRFSENKCVEKLSTYCKCN